MILHFNIFPYYNPKKLQKVHGTQSVLKQAIKEYLILTETYLKLRMPKNEILP